MKLRFKKINESTLFDKKKTTTKLLIALFQLFTSVNVSCNFLILAMFIFGFGFFAFFCLHTFSFIMKSSSNTWKIRNWKIRKEILRSTFAEGKVSFISTWLFRSPFPGMDEKSGWCGFMIVAQAMSEKIILLQSSYKKLRKVVFTASSKPTKKPWSSEDENHLKRELPAYSVHMKNLKIAQECEAIHTPTPRK